ncbi:MAG: diguanylate cyclase [Acidimicrobiales bacterium]|nr:diguanylate cyclase [Acidimicrobiales bacterium]
MRSKFRATVLVSLLITQLIIVLALYLLAGQITGTAQANHTDALLEAAAVESADRIRTHIEPAEAIVALAATLSSDPGLSPPEFRSTFISAIARTPQLSGVFIGTADGSFFDVRQTEDGIRVKTITEGPSDRTTTLEILDANGTVATEREDPTDTYDPRARPWYLEAMADPTTLAWTDPYVFFTSRQLGITAAQAITRNGEVVGVVGADIELGSLSTFLSTLGIQEPGGTVIVDDSGLVIAHPNPELVQRAEDDEFKTVAIAELDDPFARAAIASLVEAGPDDTSSLHGFSGEDIGDARASFRSVPIHDGEWTVGVFAPEGGLVPSLSAARARERLLTVAVGALSVVLVGFTALTVTRPIRDLEKRASTDPLTGLANRRTVLRAAERAAAADGDRGAAMLDLDHFKQINDTYGHPAGDEVIRVVASRIKDAVSDDEASVGRIGGEEFLVIFHNATPTEASQACNRIRERVRSEPIPTTGGPIKVTASIGLATVDSICTAKELLASADTSLLEAKFSGRDRTIAGHYSRSAPEDDLDTVGRYEVLGKADLEEANIPAGRVPR